MTVNCIVELNNHDQVYYSGQTVIGHVVLTVDGTESIPVQGNNIYMTYFIQLFCWEQNQRKKLTRS